MKTLLFACLPMLTGLAHAQTRQAPAPLWERVIATGTAPTSGQTAKVSILAVTPQCLIVSGGPGPGGLQALDAQTGKTLWQREGHWQSAHDEDPESGTRHSWSVIGVAKGSREETVCLLEHAEQEVSLNLHAAHVRRTQTSGECAAYAGSGVGANRADVVAE